MAVKADIVIDQGATFQTSIYITDETGTVVPLTGYTANAQMRKHYTSAIAYTFTTAIDAANGIVTLSMSANNTSNIPAGRYVYDCELTANTGVVSRLFEGIVTVTPQVTR